MSKLNVDNIENRLGTGGPQLPGATFTDNIVGTAASFTGIVTATSFTGNVTGNVTGTATTATNAEGLTGNPTISVTDITATGNVSIAGTLTYEDVTNVDSIGIITAQSGIDVTSGDINVGSATTITDGGLNVTGVITATSFSGDGSQLQGIESGERDFVASGSISNGDAVIINTNGTVSVVSGVGSTTPDAGTPVVFESASSQYISATYDSTNQKVVIAYSDVGNSFHGTAIVGTVSGTSITFGTPVIFENDTASEISATYDSTNQKVVIAYSDGGNSNWATAVVGTVSGTSISFGTPVVFENANTGSISAVYDSTNQKVVIAYQNAGTANRGTAVVGTVSGTSISFGTAVVFDNSATSSISATYDSTNQKVVIAYRRISSGAAIVGTVSGTSISFGSLVIFESSDTNNISAVYDSSNQKVVIAYIVNSRGTAIVGTVSGTSIVFVAGPNTFSTGGGDYISATYDSANNRVVIAYRDTANSNYGTVIDGVVNTSSVNTLNHSISFGIPTVFESASTFWISATYGSTNQKVVVAYRDNGNADYGTASVITSTNLSSNLSDENYIGIAAEAISDTATGKINIIGGVNSGQTGLTVAQTHYVSPIDGSLSVSPYGEGIPGIPIVVAGTAISSTEIVVKDGADSSSTTILGGSGTGGNSGAWNLLSTVTASGASTVDFTTNIDSTYRTYVITGSEVVSSVDTSLRMRFYDNGVLNTSGEYDFNHVRLEGGVLSSSNNVDSPAVILTDQTNAGVGRGLNMVEVVIDNPSASKTHYKAKYEVLADVDSDLVRTMGVGVMAKATAYTKVDGVQFFPQSGTLNGTFKLYGIS